MRSIAYSANAQFDRWSKACSAGDTFRFAKMEGDRALIARVRRRLRELGCDPLSPDMLLLSDVEQGICQLVEAAQKLDQLELVLNDTSATDRRTIERIAEVFYG